MASKKKSAPVADTQSAASAAEHPEYATQMPSEPAPQAPAPAQASDREAQIREAAYAAYERRSGAEGDAVQDWLDAEAQWERDQAR